MTTNVLLHGDNSIVLTSAVSYSLFDSGATIKFDSTGNDSITSWGNHNTFQGIGNQNLSVHLQGSNYNTLDFSRIEGRMSVSDFNKTDTFTLRNEGFASGQAAFNALQPDGHGGQFLALGGRSIIDFVHSNLTAASFHVANS